MSFGKQFALLAACIVVGTASGLAVLSITPSAPRDDTASQADYFGDESLNHDARVEVATAISTPTSDLEPYLVPTVQPTPQLVSGPVRVSPLDAPQRQARLTYVAMDARPHLMSPDFAALPIAPPSVAEQPDAWAAIINPAKRSAPATSKPAARVSRLPWHGRTPVRPSWDKNLEARLNEIGPAARRRLAEKFAKAQVAWPPAEIALVAIKDQKEIELHAKSQTGSWKFVHLYPVTAASGGSGPKLRRGDKQVPEGVYGISFLNPNSRYHVSLRVNYPNKFDREMAEQDGRESLGGDIMIHGKNVSAGCLAVGDIAAEELFVLAAETGLTNIKVVIAPTDFRSNGVPQSTPGQPSWVSKKLYTEVASAMSDFKAPPKTPSLLSFFGN